MTTDLISKEIDALNDITKVLIDSQKGYQKAYEITGENYSLKPQFLHRAQERSKLVDRFQSQVRSMGGEPETNGGLLAGAHRGWMQFTALFSDDEHAALEAIDDGEEHLAESIEKRLERDDIHGETRALLNEAYRSAKEGEVFADARTS